MWHVVQRSRGDERSRVQIRVWRGRGFARGVRVLGHWSEGTMSGVQPAQEKVTAAGAGRAAAPAEAPFVPEAASPAERAAGWKNPPSRMQLIFWSGSKRHVFIGMLGVSVLATIPWLMLTSGAKHDSHADYMDRAEGARRARLSNASAAVAPPTSS